MIKNILLLSLSMFLLSSLAAQDIEHNYQLVTNLDTKMKRKIVANEIMIDDEQNYIVVNYGNKPTYIMVYSISNFELLANFRLSDWVEFSGAYVDTEQEQLYVKESRYSSEYYRLDIKSGEQDILACSLTPAGCPNDDPKKSHKEVFTNDKSLYVAINKRNSREVKVYRKK